MSLKNLRKSIDTVDKEIVKLLNDRVGLAAKVAHLKKGCGQGAYSPDREREVLKKIAQINRGELSGSALEAIYREIMSASLCLCSALKVAYLGPEASFTNLAAIKRFGTQVEYIPCNSISEIFAEAQKDNADYGVVPIENSVEGAISHTFDMFVDSDLKICNEIYLDITHNLLANCPKDKIKKIYSKYEVFGQCRLWLQKNIPGAELIDVSSTTRAAQVAAKEKNSACIASTLAAKIYGLKTIASGIEDSPHNITRFLVIGKTDVSPTKNDKTSVMFSIKDRVGALHDMLMPFKKYKINLTKIESRPSKKKAWDYYFYVDFKGHALNPGIKKALEELETKCKFLKVLGSYPMGE